MTVDASVPMPRVLMKVSPLTLSFSRPSCSYFNRFWLETAMYTLPGHDHTSTSTSFLDGRGGTDSASKDGKSMNRTGPNYCVSYPENSTAGLNDLIYSCSILPSIHQTWCICIKSRPLPQRPFHRPHSVQIVCPSPYRGVYQAVPLQI